MEKISAAVILLLAGLLLTGCHKTVAQQTAPATGITISGDKAQSLLTSLNLGAVNLTNHYDTCVPLGAGKDCVLTPNMIDSHNVQLTLAVESKTAKGKVHDLSITQVVARSGKSFEVAVGDFNFSLTPNVTSD
jgi:hypothetical protein